MSVIPKAVSTLRSYLLNALSSIPGSRAFHLHVLASTPRKPGQSLFPHAELRPKCIVQDVLVLLSEEATPENGSLSVGSSQPDTSPDLIPRTFVSAIEASVYAFPASSSTILYVTKVDGTGQGAYPSPTSTLLRALLVFYASPSSPLYTPSPTSHHLWLHLFARSQRQYLFPNSGDHPNKRPLGDVALCKWWKKIISDVTRTVEATQDMAFCTDADGTMHSIRLYYLLPGQTEQEAMHMLRDADPSSSAPKAPWIYSHPYVSHADAGTPFPSSMTPEITGQSVTVPPLAYLVPHFEDDPKSRFLDELAATSEEQSVAVPIPTPRKKRQKIREETTSSLVASGEIENSSEIKSERGAQNEYPLKQPTTAPPIMCIPPSSSPPREATPPPSMRPSTPESAGNLQNIASPHVSKSPVSLLTPRTPQNTYRSSHSPLLPQSPSPRGTPKTPQTPRRPKTDLDAITVTEFWERMSFRQECAAGAVTGFFVALFSNRSRGTSHNNVDTLHPSPASAPTEANSGVTPNDHPALLFTGVLPHSILKRVISTLLTGVEFSTTDRSHKGTRVMESAIKGLCQGVTEGKSSSENLTVKSAEVGLDNDPTDATLNIYVSHIYAFVSTSNPPLVRKSGVAADVRGAIATAPVNVLGVRRKKKK